MIANMPARRIVDDKRHYDDGAVMQVLVWEVPKSVPGSAHRYKDRLYYGYPGRRLVGYDNERGKGDHRHVGDSVQPYVFISLERLFEDFLSDIEEARTA